MKVSLRWHTMLLAALSLGLILFLAGCGAEQQVTPEATDEAATPEGPSDVVSATGEVVPATWATLSFPISGQVVELLVEEDMAVEEGDVLARLDTRDLDAALARSEASLSVAEANLALAEAGPREEEVKRAQDQLAAANARVSVAVAQRNQLNAPPDPDAVIDAQARVQDATTSLADIQESYDAIIYTMNDWDDDLDPGERTPLAAEQNARYQLELANLQLAQAQAELEDLVNGPHPDEARVADAQVWVAAANRDAAQAALNLVLAGPSESDIAIAEAEVESARAAVESARAALEQTTLVAPFSGTVSTLYIDQNEFIGSGEQILQLADLTTLRVETTDLNELDVARIGVGSPATITFDALPDVTITGTVASIAPKSEEGAGVNYTVIVDLSEIPEELLWGMTAFVDIQAEQGE